MDCYSERKLLVSNGGAEARGLHRRKERRKEGDGGSKFKTPPLTFSGRTENWKGHSRALE